MLSRVVRRFDKQVFGGPATEAEDHPASVAGPAIASRLPLERNLALPCRHSDHRPIGLISCFVPLLHIAPQCKKDQPQDDWDPCRWPIVLEGPCRKKEQQNDRERTEELRIGLEAMYDG